MLEQSSGLEPAYTTGSPVTEMTWASRLSAALVVYFGCRSIYLLITEGPNPLATSITLMWTSLLVQLWLRKAKKKESP